MVDTGKPRRTAITEQQSVPDDAPLLIERARTGDQTAWTELVETYRPQVLVWCRGRLPQAADAEDACQEVFFRLSQKMHRFRRRSAADSFAGWLYVLTRRLCVDFRRRRSRRVRALSEGSSLPLEQVADRSLDPQQTLARRELNARHIRQVRHVLQREFSDLHGQVFEAVVLKERAPKDVAAELGVTANVVHLAKSRILGHLRRCLVND